jgi:hypothetical protein
LTVGTKIGGNGNSSTSYSTQNGGWLKINQAGTTTSATNSGGNSSYGTCRITLQYH